MIFNRASRLALYAFRVGRSVCALGAGGSAETSRPEQTALSVRRPSGSAPDELAAGGEGITIRRLLSGLVAPQGCGKVNKTASVVYCSRIGENNYAGAGVRL